MAVTFFACWAVGRLVSYITAAACLLVPPAAFSFAAAVLFSSDNF